MVRLIGKTGIFSSQHLKAKNKAITYKIAMLFQKGIPDIMIYQHPDVETVGNRQWSSQKMFLYLDRCFDNYENALIYDTDVFFVS